MKNLLKFSKQKIMRCMGKLQQWTIVLITIGFFSLPIVTPALSAGAAHLIKAYLKVHPINMFSIHKMQANVLKKLTISADLKNIDIKKHLPAVSIYPIKSKKLTPGPIHKRKISAILPQPVFLIGNDVRSKKWLMIYAPRLKQLKAIGFAVNVENQKEMQNLRSLAPEIPLYPMPADALAKWLNLKHYPVLISKHLIEQ